MVPTAPGLTLSEPGLEESAGETGQWGVGRGCLTPGSRGRRGGGGGALRLQNKALLSLLGSEVSRPLPASGRPPGSGDQRWEGWAHAGSR